MSSSPEIGNGRAVACKVAHDGNTGNGLSAGPAHQQSKGVGALPGVAGGSRRSIEGPIGETGEGAIVPVSGAGAATATRGWVVENCVRCWCAIDVRQQHPGHCSSGAT